MSIYIIYILIILVTVILYFLVKDKREFLRKLGITSIVSSIIILTLGIILNIALSTFLNNFNITKIASIILDKFIHNSIFLLVIGLTEILISKFMKKRRKKHSSSSKSVI